MQCLLSVPEFNYYFSKKIYKKEKLSKSSDACEAMYDLIETYNDCDNKSMMATKSLYAVCHSFLRKNEQHDCQEFLRRLIGKIQEELNSNKKYTIPDKVTFDQAWKIIRDNNPSFIDSIFTGLMRGAVICHKCKFQSSK